MLIFLVKLGKIQVVIPIITTIRIDILQKTFSNSIKIHSKTGTSLNNL